MKQERTFREDCESTPVQRIGKTAIQRLHEFGSDCETLAAPKKWERLRSAVSKEPNQSAWTRWQPPTNPSIERNNGSNRAPRRRKKSPSECEWKPDPLFHDCEPNQRKKAKGLPPLPPAKLSQLDRRARHP